MTICKCSKCGKELHKIDREFCSKMNVTECSECRYLQIKGNKMKILERNENTLIIKMPDGVAIVHIQALIYGDDKSIIGHSFHEDFPVTPQPITRYSTTAQMILSFLITGR